MLALTQADLVGLLVKVATAFARLMMREQASMHNNMLQRSEFWVYTLVCISFFMGSAF